MQCIGIERLPIVRVKSPSSSDHSPREFTNARSPAGNRNFTLRLSPGFKDIFENPRKRLLSGTIEATWSEEKSNMASLPSTEPELVMSTVTVSMSEGVNRGLSTRRLE